ncbi:MAG TPA: glycine betaine ABC transporter substrate-binding protein [Candidatus Limnocylindria bacterium]|nr:glycine betaine ABC transporter substrate-binding protein [Candidatus Limnocylindria bacterium]
MSRRLAVFALAATLACDGRQAVVVGGKNFTEQRVLGELIAQAIERAGIPVERRLDLGGTLVCDAALRAGDIDVYVEYTGTALTAILHEPPGSDAAAVRVRVAAAYEAAGLAWMPPLGFDNTFALVVRPGAGVRRISDAVPRAASWQAAYGYEFASRADGAPLLERVYGLRFAGVRTMDLGLLYQALAERQVDLVVGSATDAAIDRWDLVVLEDDRHAFPPYEAAPVVRRDALVRHAGLAGALGALAGTLDAAAMRRLNAAVDIERRSPAEVVTAWLASR